MARSIDRIMGPFQGAIPHQLRRHLSCPKTGLLNKVTSRFSMIPALTRATTQCYDVVPGRLLYPLTLFARSATLRMTDTAEQRINLEDNSERETSDMADKEEQPQEQGEDQQEQAKEGGSMFPGLRASTS